MLKKYYTCEVLNPKFVVSGSGFVKIWIWNSPEVAYDALIRDKPKGFEVVNFRRVK